MVKFIENFISEETCDYIIKKYGNDLKEMTVLGSDNYEKYRVAEGNWIFYYDEIIQEIKENISKIIETPISHQEKPHIVKYNVGGEYKKHHDFFHPNTDYYDTCMKNGGQRKYSCIIYLNDDFEGGQTKFETWDITINPKKGALCIWDNITEEGILNRDSIHAGLPVISGKKYVLLIWVRENEHL